jgi:imidazoleglycerol-phosphate dehydratase / histidinol-phosphatase
MSDIAPKILFVDRDGTLVVEPPDQQVDSYDKFALVPGVVGALRRIVDAGYLLVMVTNQDGLGTPAFPDAAFAGPQRLLLDVLAGEGIRFHEVLVDRSLPADACDTRKPALGLVRHYLGSGGLDRSRSAVVGDRASDLEFAANIGVRGFRIGIDCAWPAIAHALVDAPRTASVERSTRETRIAVRVDLDDRARPSVSTGIGFFDHMLEQLGVHGGFSLELDCVGDLRVDEHHTVEDCAIALGDALHRALGERRGIERYGFVVPMDEALATATLDLSGRSHFAFAGNFARERIGDLPSELVPHFFSSLAGAMRATLHLEVKGDNAHHMVEACFKSVGRALRQAAARRGGVEAIPSSKGVLA